MSCGIPDATERPSAYYQVFSKRIYVLIDIYTALAWYRAR